MPNNTQTQNDRRDTIRELLLGEPAATQRALVSALTGRGFVATQSSVSRDLKELGAVKTPHGYELPKYSRVDDDEIGRSKGCKLLLVRTNQHVVHEQCVIGACANDANLQSVVFVPSRESIDHINTFGLI